MRETLILAVCLLASGCIPTLAQPTRDWEPADVEGPLLFTATLVRFEDFQSTNKIDYVCSDPSTRQETRTGDNPCGSDECGLERDTFNTDSQIEGTAPRLVTTIRLLGQFCEGNPPLYNKFLVYIDKGKHWAAYRIYKLPNGDFVEPDIFGCIANHDMGNLIQNAGINQTKDKIDHKEGFLVAPYLNYTNAQCVSKTKFDPIGLIVPLREALAIIGDSKK